MDCMVHGVAKSQTRLSDFHFSSRCFPEVVIFMDFEYLFPLHPKNEVYPQRAT